MPSVGCPVCKERVFVDASTAMGDFVKCEECESELELVGLDPFVLDPAVEEDDEVRDGFNVFENED